MQKKTCTRQESLPKMYARRELYMAAQRYVTHNFSNEQSKTLSLLEQSFESRAAGPDFPPPCKRVARYYCWL